MSRGKRSCCHDCLPQCRTFPSALCTQRGSLGVSDQRLRAGEVFGARLRPWVSGASDRASNPAVRLGGSPACWQFAAMRCWLLISSRNRCKRHVPYAVTCSGSASSACESSRMARRPLRSDRAVRGAVFPDPLRHCGSLSSRARGARWCCVISQLARPMAMSRAGSMASSIF